MRCNSLFRYAAASVPLAGLICASAAHAQATITLNNPNQTVTVPASGSVTVNFTGTLAYAQGYSETTANVDVPFLANSLTGLNSTFGPVNFSAPNNGNSASGLLFTVTVPSTASIGNYGFKFNSLTPSALSVTVQNTAGSSFTTSANFSVNVVAAGVPEPDSIALLVGMGISGAGFLVRRRR